MTSLTVTAAMISLTAAFEGFSSRAYLDPVKVPTIGYGETRNVKMGDTITRENAQKLLGERLREHADDMISCINVPLTQNEFDAYLDFTYNVGATKFCRSTLAKKLNAGDYTGACNELLKWNKANGKILSGLMNRRAKENELCLL